MIDSLIVWFINWFIGWSIDWSIDFIDWLTDWLIHWMNQWMMDSLIEWLVSWLMNWLNQWMMDSLIDWLVSWLMNWLIECWPRKLGTGGFAFVYLVTAIKVNGIVYDIWVVGTPNSKIKMSQMIKGIVNKNTSGPPLINLWMIKYKLNILVSVSKIELILFLLLSESDLHISGSRSNGESIFY